MRIAHSVAIVGVGPKGLYCLERLLAEFNAKPLRQALDIHLFNRSPHFGASPIYDPEQPEYILVNVSIGEVDLWTAEDPPSAAGRGLGFVDWYHDTFQSQTSLNGDEYLSRAVVGRYLIEGFQRILKQLPTGVTIWTHVGELIDIQPDGGKYQLEFVPEGGNVEKIQAHKVLLATGHSRLRPKPEDSRFKEFASRHAGTDFIPFVYPVVESMRPVPSGSRVAMKGIGLTFIDAVLELTEGRGGRFERVAEGSLSYYASGREPQSIIVFSRTGLPMTPKAYDLPLFLRPLTFFTAAALQRLRLQALDGKIDFERDLWDLFESEMELCYYRVEMGPGDDRELLESCGDDTSAMHRVIDAYLQSHPDKERFDYRQVVDPFTEQRFDGREQLNSFVARYMEQEIARARLGQAGCGVKAAIDIWYEVRKQLSSVIQFGGLTPESHRRLFEYHFPRLKRVVFGPPIINIEKLLALLKAGLLDFSVARNPHVLTDEVSGCYVLRCDENPAACEQCEILIDARYPSVNMREDAAPLYRNLCRRGMVRVYENRLLSEDGSSYCAGAIDMIERSQFVVDERGVGNKDIAVIGIPTEGNLVGNKTITRDEYPGIWAAEVIAQLRSEEGLCSSPQPM